MQSPTPLPTHDLRNAMNERAIRIQAQSFEVYSQGTQIGFEPPFGDRAENPTGFYFWWRMLQYVFSLPDPNKLAPLAIQLSVKDRGRVDRYLQAAEELASGPFMSHGGGVTVRLAPGVEEEIEADFAHKENLRGFSVLFRQFYSRQEGASFGSMMDLAWQQNAKVADDDQADREDFIKAWRKAEGRLRQRTANVAVGKRAVALGVSAMSEVPFEWHPTPERLISAFFYGDLIHWGQKVEELSLYRDCDFSDAAFRMSLFQAVTGLAHIYLGAAVAIRSFFPE